jgi:hypothetical protein
MQNPEPNSSRKRIALVILAATFFLVIFANYFKAPTFALAALTLVGIVVAVFIGATKKHN